MKVDRVGEGEVVRVQDLTKSEKIDMLRVASKMMREEHPPSHERHAMWSAMADLLDTNALIIDGTFAISPVQSIRYAVADPVVKVAWEYLGAPR